MNTALKQKDALVVVNYVSWSVEEIKDQLDDDVEEGEH